MKSEPTKFKPLWRIRPFSSLMVVLLIGLTSSCAGESTDLLGGTGDNSGNVNFRGFGGADATASVSDLGSVTPGPIGSTDVATNPQEDSGVLLEMDSSSSATDTNPSPPNPPQDTQGSGSEDPGNSADTWIAPEQDTTSPPDEDPCEPACAGKQCGPDQCGGICGTCFAGQTCSTSGQCISEGLQPFGGPCQVTADCQPTLIDSATGIEVENPAWPNCLDSQCDQSGGANQCLAPYQPYCSTICTLINDTVDNASGAPGADGIEDPNSSAGSCKGASTALTDGPWSCVRLSPFSGNSFGACMPGEEFWPCSTSSDCPNDEVCKFMIVAGIPEFRCAPPLAGTKTQGEMCEANSYAPAVNWFTENSYCESNLCLDGGLGCSEPCASDLDCAEAPPGGGCNGGVCALNPNYICVTDADCSPSLCGAISFSSGETLNGCVPRSCNIDSNCVDPDYYCRTTLNSGADPFDITWQHRCVPKPELTVGLGEACEQYPELGDTQNLCTNPDWCMDGFCGSHCTTEGDCAINQRCSTLEFNVDADEDGTPDMIMPLGICQTLPHAGPSVPCTRDGDCGVAQVCAPILSGLPPQNQSVSRKCVDLAGRQGFGSPCGESVKKSCATGLCYAYNISPNPSPVCTGTCDSANDCGSMNIDGALYPTICAASRLGQNATMDDTTDDSFVPLCFPVEPGSSLIDCSGSLSSLGATANAGKCGFNERCYMNPIYSEAGSPAKIEMLCEGIPAGAYLPLGSACTAGTECMGGLCNQGQCIEPCDPIDIFSCSGTSFSCLPITVFDQPEGQDDLLAWFCVP